MVERRFRGYWRLTGLYLMRHGFQLRRHGKKLLRWSEAQRDKWDKNQEDQPHSDAVAQFFDALVSIRFWLTYTKALNNVVCL